MAKKPRAAVLLFRDGHLLTLFRRKNGEEYHTVPGGKVDPGETPEEAAVREMLEETGLSVRLKKKLWSMVSLDRQEYFYLAAPCEGEPVFQGPEMKKASAENIYRLEWIALPDLPDVDLRPPEAKIHILNEFA